MLFPRQLTRCFLLGSLLLLSPFPAAKAQTSHPNRISLSLYQVGAPMESGFNTPVHRVLSGLYYERSIHDQWQVAAGVQYWQGTYSEGANLPGAGPDGIATASLEDWGILVGAKYLPAWCRTSFVQPFLQHDWMYGQSEYELQLPNPGLPATASTSLLNSHTINGFLRGGVETYWFQSRMVLSFITAHQTRASGVSRSEVDEVPVELRVPLRGRWLPFEVRAAFRF